MIIYKMCVILFFDWKIYFYRNLCDIDFIYVIEEILNVIVSCVGWGGSF